MATSPRRAERPSGSVSPAPGDRAIFFGGDAVMTDEQRQNEYLKKANEAEAQAAKCSDREQRESWLKIAASYRALAKPN